MRDRQRAAMLNVLIATRYFDFDDVVEVLEREAGASVVRCHYVDDPAVRALRAQQPNDPSVAARITPLTSDQQRHFAAADIVLGFDLPARLPQIAPRLRWFHLSSSGFGHCAHAGLPDGRIAVTHSPGTNSPGVAEFALARIFEHAKRLPELADMQRRREWRLSFGRMVAGQALTIVGLGSIGRELARRALALGMRVQAVGRPGTPPRIDAETGVTVTSDLHAAVAAADAVVLCAADTSSNHNLFDAGVFAAMKPGALFINVARGIMVDETALTGALADGRLAAAALDVTVAEPMPADDPLWSLANVRHSYHSATAADGSRDRKLAILSGNLRRFLAGEPLQHELAEFTRRVGQEVRA